MRGHIRRRCTRCSATVKRGRACKRCGAQTLSYGWTCDAGRDASGKRLQRSGAGFATRRDAERALRAEIKRLEDGGNPFPERQTVETFVARWLDHQSARLRPRTWERYRDLLRLHVLPEIGGLELDKVRPAHVQRVLDAMSAKGLSASTIRQARAVLSSAMRQALEWQYVSANPVVAVRPPKVGKPHRARPTPEQLAAFIAAARAEPVWEIPMLLASTSGARRSEVLAVSWPAVDLRAGKVRIVRSLQKAALGRGPMFAELKTPRARREIVLLPVVAERLRQHRKEQLERHMELGAAWHDDDDLQLVCDRGDGLYLEPDDMTRAFKRIAAAAGLPAAFHLHDLRHGVATAMLLAGVHPAIASAVLGHSSPAFTMSVYQEVTAGMTEQAAVALEKALDV